jgi:hypothetical protein
VKPAGIFLAALAAAIVPAASPMPLPAPPAAPVTPPGPAGTVPSRPQLQVPTPAPRTAAARRNPMAPPPQWQALERKNGDTPRAPRVPGIPAPGGQLPPPPLPQLPLPPVPEQPARPAAPPAPPVQTEQAPEVEYLGMATGPGGTYAVLRTGNQVHVLQAGQQAGEFVIVSITPDHVTLRAAGRKTVVRIGQQPSPTGRVGR